MQKSRNTKITSDIVKHLVHIANENLNLKDLLKNLTEFLMKTSSCKMGGIRLFNKNRNVIEFGYCKGFSKTFIKKENRLLLYGKGTCFCHKVFIGDTNYPYFKKGAFVSNSIKESQRALVIFKNEKPRGYCLKCGFASICIFPIIHQEKVTGLVHLCDKKPNKFSNKFIKYISLISEVIGTAIIKCSFSENSIFFKEILDKANEGIYIIDPETSRIIDANQKGLELLNCTKKDLPKITKLDSRFPTLKDWQKYVKFLKKEDTLIHHGIYKNSNDEKLFLKISSKYITLNYMDYIVYIMQDLSNIKFLEKELEKNKEKYINFFLNLPFPAVIFEKLDSKNLEITGVNLAFENTFKVFYKDISKKTLNEIYPSIYKILLTIAKKIKNETRTLQTEYKLERTNKLFDITAFKLNSSEYVCIFKDKTEKIKALKEKEILQNELIQSQKMEAIGRLSSGIAHDFNNLLTAIKGYAELLLMKNLDLTIKNSINEIFKSSERAQDLTRQLLLFSQKQEIMVSPLSLNKILKDIWKLMTRLIGENIKLKIKENPDLDLILADRSNIEQVILNLIINAKDAMPEGGTIFIETENINKHSPSLPPFLNKETNYVILKVKDNGSGIKKENLPRIFEPFFTTKEKGKGTGLGLSVVYGIVKRHGGEIKVSSKVGEGTVFEIYLPSAESACQPPEVKSQIKSKKMKGNREIILLIEDENMVRNITKKILEDSNYEVIDVSTCGEAKKVFKRYKHKIKLVLTDMVLEDGYGLELINELKRQNKNLKSLIMSGYADINIKEKDINFIKKPFNIVKLLNTIKNLVN